MRQEIASQMESWNAAKGDRIDSVAQMCRRLHLRVQLCPCKFGGRDTNNCHQCKNDLDIIEKAWTETDPTRV